jgi:hypothetical protein
MPARILNTQVQARAAQTSLQERQRADSGAVESGDIRQVQHNLPAVTMGERNAAQNIHFFSGHNSSDAAQQYAVFQVVDLH